MLNHSLQFILPFSIVFLSSCSGQVPYTAVSKTTPSGVSTGADSLSELRFTDPAVVNNPYYPVSQIKQEISLGTDNGKPALFMPSHAKVGQVFNPENLPGVAFETDDTMSLSKTAITSPLSEATKRLVAAL
jgi:hypothetical protein